MDMGEYYFGIGTHRRMGNEPMGGGHKFLAKMETQNVNPLL
jgi:hypothetical protein